MKNKFAIVSAGAILLSAILGCGSVNPFSSKNNNQGLTNRAIDTAVPDAAVGIPECDEVMKMLTDLANNPDDNFAEKAAKRIFANKIKDSIKQAVEDNKGNKADLGKACTAFKQQIQKFQKS